MDKQRLEEITQEICEIFEIYAPPVPVETMLSQPPDDLWEEIDIAQLSGSFLSLKEKHSPRISLARLLARHIIGSDWGKERGLGEPGIDAETVRSFARMLLMPADMIESLTSTARNPQSISHQFEAPESEAEKRLLELL